MWLHGALRHASLPSPSGIGGALPPKKPLNRFVKWPKYVRIQRQKRVLCQRLKVPPALNQFTKALDKNSGKIPPLFLFRKLTERCMCSLVSLSRWCL